MADDIVTRLRQALETNESILLTMPRPTVQMMADEIERLRADVKLWRNWAEEFFYTDPDCECPLCDQVRAAIEKTVRP